MDSCQKGGGRGLTERRGREMSKNEHEGPWTWTRAWALTVGMGVALGGEESVGKRVMISLWGVVFASDFSVSSGGWFSHCGSEPRSTLSTQSLRRVYLMKLRSSRPK